MKHSEDGKVAGVKFRVTGNGMDETVTTQNDGTISIANLKPGEYTVTELSDNRYEPQEPQTVTVVSGRTAVVTFSNTLKRGRLEVTKSSEDNLVEGVKFHLFGTSLSGLTVDEYAVTDETGTAHFDNILISGNTSYTLEEVDAAERYVVPADQEAVIYWNDVTERSFTNTLKKFRVEVVKRDIETGSAQGDASLAGARYGLYQAGNLVAEYTTNANGGFVTDYFICGDGWTIREIAPSEGYLLDETIYEIPSDASNFKVELNDLDLTVHEQIIKGSIRLVKHIDKPDPDVETELEVTDSSEPMPVLEDVILQTEPVLEEEMLNSDRVLPGEPDSDKIESESEEIESDTVVMDDALDSEPEVTAETEELSETEPVLDEVEQPTPVPDDEIKPSGGEGLIEQPEEGAKFQIYLASAGSYDAAKENERDLLVTDGDGFAVSKDLPYGRYRVHQIEGMDGQAFIADFTVFICENGQTYSYILNNQTTSSLIRVEKRDAETGNIIAAANVGFQVRDLSTNELIIQTVYYAAEEIPAADGSVIPADGLIEILAIGADGTGNCSSDLPQGSYYLQERTTNGSYILNDTKYPVIFTYAGQDIATVRLAANDGQAIINELIYGSVSGKKLDDAGNALEGALIGLFTTDEGEFNEETAVLTTTSAEDGSFHFENIPKGIWYIREIRQPEGYVLCADIFPIEISENEQIVEIEIVNERIRATLSLTKIDEEYPDHKLSGAEFEVYRDVNGNKELDKEDTLLGLMEEMEAGFYEMKDVEFGGVLVREKTAPEGFYLDENVYYVSIESDGETYTVENKAGVGFINQAHRGNLKIIKTSSDGKLEGFTFRISGEDYDRTFTTGSDGIIFIENLRVGKYTVTELDDEMSEGYRRPDPVTVELVTDETLTVNVHNEKVTVDVPKTGDDSNLWIWGSLLGLSALGAGALVFVDYKRRKRIVKK